MSVSVNFNLSKTGKAVADQVGLAFREVALLVQREAKRNAPRSPTVKQINATLVRKKRTKRRAFAGGLEKSIECEVQGHGANATAAIFVASNSPAGKYAKRIHDEKGIKWFKRGTGTVQKGARADEKFIERAIKDNQETIQKKLNKAVERGTK